MPDPIAQGDLGVNMCQTNHTKKGVVWINPSNNHAHRTCWLIDYWGAGSSSSRNTWNRTISLQRLLIKGLGYSAVSFDYCCVIGGRTTHLRNIFANLGTRISNFKQEQKHNAFQPTRLYWWFLSTIASLGVRFELQLHSSSDTSGLS